jgi:CheY-like chemotaxis protein
MTKKILWLDEEPDSLRYESRIVENMGFQIVWASTVSGAVKLIRDHCFDLVIADLLLPLDEFHRERGSVDMEAGLKFIETLRNNERTGNTPVDIDVIVITAVVSTERLEKVRNTLNVNGLILHKPIRSDQFEKIMTRLIHSRLSTNVSL